MNKFFYPGLAFFLILLFTSLICPSKIHASQQEREYYELRIYHLQDQQQEERVDKYLKDAFLPALQRAGINKVGVFKPVEEGNSDSSRIYVFIPYRSANQYMELPEVLRKDSQYWSAGKDYLEAAHDNPPYNRIETILLLAFKGMPQFQETGLTNPAEEKIYELRSYESATEELFRNKVQMFNQGEIDIFNRLGFNPVFFGEVRAGSHMPNLMYMTTHASSAAQEKNWQAFRVDAQWKEMAAMEEYQNNVSHIDIILLHPTNYSGI